MLNVGSKLKYASLLLLAALLILSACGGGAGTGSGGETGEIPTVIVPDTDNPVYGGTLSIAFVATSPHIDVNSVNQGSINEFAHYFYETLFDRDPTGATVGLLVKEAHTSDDGLVHTWHLQPGVKFHDGTDFDAEAVRFNLQRKIDKKQPLADLIPFESIEVIDPLTVQVKLTHPLPGLNNVLATKTFSMYSPAYVEKVGDDGLKNGAVGTGPFMVESFVPNESLILVKNPNYWQEGLPYLDKVEFKVVPDANTRASMLEAGDIDMSLALPAPVLEDLKRDPTRFTVYEAIGSTQYYMAMNNKRAPLDDVRVRQAINHAVDKEGIIRAVFLGTGASIAKAVYINETIDGYSEAGFYEYDTAKAAALLDEAGWTLGSDGIREKDGKKLSLSLYTRKGGTAGDYEIAELVQGMLKDVGIEVKLELFESAAFVPAVTKPADEAEYDLANLSVGTFTGDADYTMRTFYHSSSAAPRYYNRAYFANDEVDRLIEKSLTVATKAERDEIYAQVNRLVFEQAPILQLFDTVQKVAMRSNVKGVYFEPAGSNWPAKYAWKTP